MSDPRPPRDEVVDPSTEPDPVAPEHDAAAPEHDAAAREHEPEPVELIEPAEPVAARTDPPPAVVATDADYDDDADTEHEVTPPVPAVVPTPLTPPDHSRVVYVEAPRPPRTRHNRGFGAVMALLSTLIFGAVYLGLSLLILGTRDVAAADIAGFAMSGQFLVPVGAFALFSVLLALAVNRAPWWVHVLGSLIVGILVYAVSIGVLLLLSGVVSLTQEQAAAQLAFAFANPIFTVAGLVAREVSLWVGLGIAARGRRVKARNIEARETYDREQAEARAAQDRVPDGGYPVTT